jgi:hypothetical protein
VGWRSWAVVCSVALTGCVERASTMPQGIEDTVAAVEVIASDRDAITEPGALHFTADEAECMAGRVVTALGVNRLRDVGLDLENGLPPDLSQPPLNAAEADIVYRAMEGCLDLPAQLADLFIDGGTTTAAPTADCMAQRYLETELPRRALLAARHDPELNTEIQRFLTLAQAACE